MRNQGKRISCLKTCVNFGGLDGAGFMKTIVNFFETQRLI